MNEAAHDSVSEVLGELDELAAKQDEVCIGDVLDDFGARSFGPFLMLPAMIEMSPVGGIPGVPTFLALIVLITASQLLLGKDHVWMPMFVQRRAVTGKRLHQAVRKLRGIGTWLDAHSEGRLEQFTTDLWPRLAGLAAMLLACCVPPLELLPFASSLPMLAIAIIGLALTVRDGAMMVASLGFTVIAAAAGIWLFNTFEVAETASETAAEAAEIVTG